MPTRLNEETYEWVLIPHVVESDINPKRQRVLQIILNAVNIEVSWRAVGVSPPSCTHITRRAHAAPLAGLISGRPMYNRYREFSPPLPQYGSWPQ